MSKPTKTTLLQYNTWYLKVGARTLKSIQVPELRDLEGFIFPAFSTLHYTSPIGSSIDEEEDELVLGPLLSDPIFRNHASVMVLVNPLTQYTTEQTTGKFVNVMPNTSGALAKYIGSANNLKKLQGNDALVNDKNIVMYTYTAFDSVYRYQKNDRSAWNRFHNWYRSVLENVRKSLQENKSRNHFLLIEPPVQISSLSHLRNTKNDMDGEAPYSERISLKWLKLYPTNQERLFLDLWLFFGSGRSMSLFNEILHDVDLEKINLLWQVGNKWHVVNVGRINSFIIAEGNSRGSVTPIQMESSWLIYVARLGSQFNPVNNDAPEDDPELSDEDKMTELDEPVRELNIDAARVTTSRLDVRLERPDKRKPAMTQNDALEKLKSDLKGMIWDKVSDAIATDEVSEDVINAAIQRDLDQLEAISAQRVIESTYEERYQPYEPIENDNLTYLNGQIDELGKKGKLSAKEVARLKRKALEFKEAKEPWGSKETIEQMMQIPPELLVVDEEVKLTDHIDGVRDKSMLNSSITYMHKRYVKEVMRKDILGAVMHLQNGPYVVTDIKVTRTTNLTDDYETLTAKILTLMGKEKQITIQYPVIKPDGSYIVGGVKSRLRSQHVD